MKRTVGAGQESELVSILVLVQTNGAHVILVSCDDSELSVLKTEAFLTFQLIKLGLPQLVILVAFYLSLNDTFNFCQIRTYLL